MLRFIPTLLLIAACSGEPPPPTQSATVVAPQTPQTTNVERRARFDSRTTAEWPTTLPAAWTRLLKSLDARLLKSLHRAWSYQTDWRGGTAVGLTARVFGLDDAVDARILKGLQSLNLPKLTGPLRDQTVTAGQVEWSISIDRVKAPPGAERETQLELTWSRQPRTDKRADRCRKPHPVPAPSAVPGWLAKVTEKRTTRRRILAESTTSICCAIRASRWARRDCAWRTFSRSACIAC